MSALFLRLLKVLLGIFHMSEALVTRPNRLGVALTTPTILGRFIGSCWLTMIILVHIIIGKIVISAFLLAASIQLGLHVLVLRVVVPNRVLFFVLRVRVVIKILAVLNSMIGSKVESLGGFRFIARQFGGLRVLVEGLLLRIGHFALNRCAICKNLGGFWGVVHFVSQFLPFLKFHEFLVFFLLHVNVHLSKSVDQVILFTGLLFLKVLLEVRFPKILSLVLVKLI